MSDTNQNTNLEHQLPFTIHIQYLKDLSFENPNPLSHLTDTTEAKPEININVQVNARHLTDRMFEVVLEISADAKRNKEQMFICQVQYAALVSLQNEHETDETIRSIVLEDCPHFLFPFARNIVADVTRDSGFPPLMLQPVDFVALNKAQSHSQMNPNNEKPDQVH